MRTDVDYIISLMKKFTDNGFKNEIGEQDAAPSAAAPSSGGGNSPSTWSDIVGSKLTRGKANKLGRSGEKWESGLTRGPANQLK
jgi:hypothetical protein